MKENEEALKLFDSLIEEGYKYTNEAETTKSMKIFISHSSKDLTFVQALVDLFEDIGLNEENMFCSSIPGYNIPLDKNIYDYLKEQFQNYNLHVIFVLSDNYYSSPVSLAEMGAAWVLQQRYTSVLLPQFNFKDIKGVIDQIRISIKLDSEKMELKARLNELRNTLIEEFGLRSSLKSQNIWERNRDKFIDKINSIEIYWKQLRQLQEQKRPLDEWIAPLQSLLDISPASCDALYMLGTIYAQLDEKENAIKCLKSTIKMTKSEELSGKAKKRLYDLGYIM